MVVKLVWIDGVELSEGGSALLYALLSGDMDSAMTVPPNGDTLQYADGWHPNPAHAIFLNTPLVDPIRAAGWDWLNDPGRLRRIIGS